MYITLYLLLGPKEPRTQDPVAKEPLTAEKESFTTEKGPLPAEETLSADIKPYPAARQAETISPEADGSRVCFAAEVVLLLPQHVRRVS